MFAYDLCWQCSTTKDLGTSKKVKASKGGGHTIEWLGELFLPGFQAFDGENLAPRLPSHRVALRDTGEEESNQVEDSWVGSFKIYGRASWEINLGEN